MTLDVLGHLKQMKNMNVWISRSERSGAQFEHLHARITGKGAERLWQHADKDEQ
jgi:hypothetical protein